MNRKKLTQWAIIAILTILLFMLGVNYVNDKQTQRRNESDAQREEAVQPGGVQGQAGNLGYIAGLDRYEESLKSFGIIMPGAAGGDRQANPRGLPEYTDHEGEQTEDSLTLLSAGGNSRNVNNYSDDSYSSADTFMKSLDLN